MVEGWKFWIISFTPIESEVSTGSSEETAGLSDSTSLLIETLVLGEHEENRSLAEQRDLFLGCAHRRPLPSHQQHQMEFHLDLQT